MNAKKWSALTSLLQKKAHTITERRTPVVYSPHPSTPLGCTDGVTIILGPGDRYTEKLNDGAVVSFYRGVFTHEVMHIIMTNFKLYKRHTRNTEEHIMPIYHTFFNVLEDGAIEHFAHKFIGGQLLKDLDYVNNVVYHHSTPIDYDGENEEEIVKNAFEQYVKAFIHYRAGGIIKGSFTFPEAKTAFLDTIDLWDRGVQERRFTERIKIVDEIFEITRPLWEKIAEDGKAAAEEFKRKMEQAGQSMTDMDAYGDSSEDYEMDEGEEGQDGKEGKESKGIPSRKSRKQKKTVMILRKSEPPKEEKGEENDGKEGEKDNEPGSGKQSGKQDGKEDGDEGGKDGDKDGKDDGSTASKPARSKPGEEDESTESSKDKADGEGEGKDEEEKDGESEKGDGDEDSESGSDESGEAEEPFNPNDYEGSEANLDELMKAIAEAMREDAEHEELQSKLPDVEITNYGIKDICKGIPCYDNNVPYDPNLESTYEELYMSMKSQIKPMTAYLKRLFHNEREERVKKHSGKVNIKRLSKNNSARVFDKIIEPGDKSDTAVFMLVDQSGSMSSNRSIENARLAAIALAEMLAPLGCPLYIMGFTADANYGNSASHDHFVKWKNVRRERVKLAGLRAMQNNFDSYSIRKATEMLKKQAEAHKLLIVISDGRPMCNAYYDSNYGEKGIGAEDTKLALREAEKVCAILGVLVGTQDPKVHEFMYGKNLIHIKKPEDLFKGISKQMKSILKGW